MWKKIKFYTVSAIIVALGVACLYLYYFGRREPVVRRVVDAQNSPSARPDFRLALNPQPLPPGYAPDDEDGRW